MKILRIKIIALSISFLSLAPWAKAAEVTLTGIAQANNMFGWSLFQNIRKNTSQNQNILFSPLSAWLALSLLSNGADGETLNELKQTLKLSGYTLDEANDGIHELVENLLSERDSGETLRIANAIWANRNIFQLSDDFINRVDSLYRFSGEPSIARSMPFDQPETLSEINQWVKESTNGMIPSILNQLNYDMAAILLNALFFEGKWLSPFSPSSTMDRPFYLLDATSKMVPMMSQNKKVFAYAENKNFQMIRMKFRTYPDGSDARFQEGRFGVEVVIPKGNDINISAFDQANYQSLIDNLKPSLLNVAIPKLKFSYIDTLNDDLIANGLKRVFKPGLAELGRLGVESSSRPVYVNQVLQKTAVEMHEGGFKAAAVTAIVVGTTSVNEIMGKPFVADRPFFIALRDKLTGTILFQGIVGNPVFQ